MNRILDLSGLLCPDVTLRTKQAMKLLRVGESLTILSTDPLSALDVPLLTIRAGYVLASQTTQNKTTAFVIRKPAP